MIGPDKQRHSPKVAGIPCRVGSDPHSNSLKGHCLNEAVKLRCSKITGYRDRKDPMELLQFDEEVSVPIQDR